MTTTMIGREQRLDSRKATEPPVAGTAPVPAGGEGGALDDLTAAAERPLREAVAVKGRQRVSVVPVPGGE